MSDEAPMSSKDMKAIQAKLKENSLLAALLMTSPAEAFKYLGYNFSHSDFDGLRPPTKDDADLAKKIITLLQSGKTQLDEPHIIQPAADPQKLKPPMLNKKSRKPADITIVVSKATLQHLLEKYTKQHFKDQEFLFPDQSWWSMSAIGNSITLELKEDKAHIVAKLTGKLYFSLNLLGLKLYEWESKFPIEISILAAFSLDENDQLYLSVRSGEISLTNAPFPASITADLIEKITSIVPYIPLYRLPTKFEVPDTSIYTSETDVRLSGVTINDEAVHLEFQLEESPNSV